MNYVEPVETKFDTESGIAARRRIFEEYKTAEQAGQPGPTVKDLVQATGLRSASTVHSHVKLLHSRGTLNKRGRRYSLARVAEVQ